MTFPLPQPTRRNALFRIAAGAVDVYPQVMAADDCFGYAKAQFEREKMLLAESGFKPE